ncbi:MAG: UDP-glucose 4-epimerase GalE [Candidatus Gastranaerophilales bacterium]|nr:UDP-glucose 4-epimerase GalE [Candidatus Gastranaerophilales bacterium]
MILITGGAGYIGSQTALNLLEKDEDVVIFDNFSIGHKEIIDEIIKEYPSANFVKGDLKNFEEINQVFKEYKIDSVLHCAAMSIVSESVVDPQKYYSNNVLGSLNLLDAMVENNVKNIVLSSSCSVYGEQEYLPIDEKHPVNPVNPYGATKLAVEGMLRDYELAYGIKFVILRYFNVIGADGKNRTGEWYPGETRLITNLMKKIVNGGVFKIFGDDYDTKDGTCVRDYINVEDIADAHKLALDYLVKNQKSEIFNLGSMHGYSVKEILNAVKKTLNIEIDVEVCKRRQGDPAVLFADSEKAKNLLGWNPQKSLEHSIETAYEWNKKLKNMN